MSKGTGQTIAQAYVQIMPSTEGIQGQLTQAMGGAAETAGSKAGGKLAAGLKTGMKMAGAAIAASSAAVAAVGKQALDSYADYEQLVGGVETLFKDSAADVQKYAANAYQTAGISANAYMETVTGFAASLVSSLDGNTEFAANMANMAISDMADNANKMGSSIESIQNAYQGFAKGNFTMLDNLKLGYGGTKTEMERLLRDAEEMEGLIEDSLSIDNFGDIVYAINIIQEEMGITGTTAKEASETISGSIAMTRAAWSNLLTGIADENADLDTLVDNFVNSAVTAGENLLPRISVILEGAGKLVTEAADRLIPIAVDALIDNLPQLIESGVRLVAALITGLIKAIPKIIAAMPDIIKAVVKGLADGWPQLKEAGTQAIDKIKESILAAVDKAKQWGKDLIQSFIDGITSKFTALKEGAKNVAQTVKDFIGFSEPEKGPLSNFHTYAPDMMRLYAQGIRENEGLLRDQLSRSFNIAPVLSAAAVLPQAAPAAAGAGGGSLGGVNISVYAAPGMDENALADMVAARLQTMIEKVEAVF